MNNVLAYDTSGESLTISVRSPQGSTHYRYDFGLRHGEILGDRVASALQDHGLKARDLDGVICSQGPGSFTGLRIGMAFAKGFSAGLGIPILSISPLEGLAHIAHKLFPDNLLLPAIDGKKKRYFWALYGHGLLMEGPGDWPPQKLLELLDEKSSENQIIIISLDKPGLRELLIQNSPLLSTNIREITDRDLPPISGSFLEVGVPRLLQGARDLEDQGPNYLRESQAIEDRK